MDRTYFPIISKLKNDLVLDIEGYHPASGKTVHMWNILPDGLGDNQLWYQEFNPGPIHSKADPNFVLDFEGGK